MPAFLAVTIRAAGSLPSATAIGQADDLDQAASLAIASCPADWLVAAVVEADHAAMVADELYRFAG